MALETYVRKSFKLESLQRIGQCREIIDRYSAMGLRLTLRQLYYQLVTVNAISNVEREYKNLSKLMSDARLAGLIDWAAIEDRIRVPRIPGEFENLDDLVEVALRSYRLPRWRSQDNYVELWVEKDALAGVLAPIGREYHVTVMVNRGYSSQSAMYESAQRFLARPDKACYLLYLGDHDPSGEDMVHDVQNRMEVFGAEVEVEKVALTMRQVEEYQPPPNPAKLSDPRAGSYVARHGESSWEVDALPPDVLQQMIRARLDGLRDSTAWNKVLRQEKSDMARLKRALATTHGT